MKKNLELMGLGLAGTVLVGWSATAQTTSFSTGDLLLGMRASGGTSDYIMNLGSASQFFTAAPSSTLSFSVPQSALNTALGTGWENNANVSWSVSGTAGNPTSVFPGLGANTLFATMEETTPGTVEAGFLRRSYSSQGAPTAQMITLGQTFAGQPSAAAGLNALIQLLPATGSYDSIMSKAGGSFGYFNSPSVEGTFANGKSQEVLDLFEMQPSTTGGNGTFLGSLQFVGVDGSGNNILEFTAVPEPSTFALLLSSGLLLLARLRRQPLPFRQS